MCADGKGGYPFRILSHAHALRGRSLNWCKAITQKAAPGYESRWQSDDHDTKPWHYKQPLWSGEARPMGSADFGESKESG